LDELFVIFASFCFLSWSLQAVNPMAALIATRLTSSAFWKNLCVVMPVSHAGAGVLTF
jgi:hypothetical protein